MDDHRSAALTDAALDRDLEAALAVDPPPEFVARVRTRVQRERDASWSPLQWGFAAAVGVLVVAIAVALVVGTSRQDRARVDAGRESWIGRDRQPTVCPVRCAGHQSWSDRAGQHGRAGPQLRQLLRPKNSHRDIDVDQALLEGTELLMAADEARALRRLFADVRKGLIDLSSLQEGVPATAALQPPGEIVFPPITFEPVAPETAQ